MDTDLLISTEYLKQNILLHQMSTWGNSAGKKWGFFVLALIHRYTIKSVLDYGCGEGSLKKRLQSCKYIQKKPIVFNEYDPAVSGKNVLLNKKVQLVVCTDVLEHVELKCIEVVIRYLGECTERFIFLTISLRKANAILPDGRNVHQIIRDKFWWLTELNKVWGDVFKINELPFHYSNELVLFIQRK